VAGGKQQAGREEQGTGDRKQRSEPGSMQRKVKKEERSEAGKKGGGAHLRKLPLPQPDASIVRGAVELVHL
jgi:hypothetical protein